MSDSDFERRKWDMDMYHAYVLDSWTWAGKGKHFTFNVILMVLLRVYVVWVVYLENSETILSTVGCTINTSLLRCSWLLTGRKRWTPSTPRPWQQWAQLFDAITSNQLRWFPGDAKAIGTVVNTTTVSLLALVFIYRGGHLICAINIINGSVQGYFHGYFNDYEFHQRLYQ